MAEENEAQSRQEAYEQAYYEAANAAGAAGTAGAGAAGVAGAAGANPQPFSDPNKVAQEQHHVDPFVAAMSDATSAQRAESNPYQQPWNNGAGQYSQNYSQGYSEGYTQGYTQGAAYQQATNQYYTTQTYETNYQPFVRTKDHVAAGLLAIFLGMFGVHKFYLGYNNIGFIMLGLSILGSLFTFGLAGMAMQVVGIIEGIIYLTKPQSTFDAIYVYGRKDWF